jgi:hypothetical protein
MGSATRGGLVGGKLGDTLGEGTSMLAGGLTALVSVGLTLAQPDKMSDPTKHRRNKLGFSIGRPSRIDPKGHDFNCIILSINQKNMGLNGTASSNHPAAVANPIYCDRRIFGCFVGSFFCVRHTWQQFKRHFALDGSSQLAVTPISRHWPHFGGHPGPVKAQ